MTKQSISNAVLTTLFVFLLSRPLTAQKNSTALPSTLCGEKTFRP